MARLQESQANQTFGTATDNASRFGAGASGISSTLTPFLNNRLLNPTGYSQGDLGAMLSKALGGAGGATSGITGQANLEAGRMRNDAGNAGVLADAARQRTKAAAGAAEGIASDNAGVKLNQQDQAAKMLQGLYGTDVGAQNASLNTADQATETGINAQKVGWLQNAMGVLNTVGGLAGGAGGLIGGLKK